MNSPILIDLFAEDRAHEEFLKAMINRIAKEETKEVSLQIRSARGGHGRVLNELSIYQKAVIHSESSLLRMPDLLIVAIDANCRNFNEARQEIEKALEKSFLDRAIIACPDPHVERWYLADPDSLKKVIGVGPKVGRKKCERGYYKSILSKAIIDAGYPPTLGGIEFAREIVENMDFYRARKGERSLNHFLNAAIPGIRSMPI
jgi:hypothetical protein